MIDDWAIADLESSPWLLWSEEDHIIISDGMKFVVDGEIYFSPQISIDRAGKFVLYCDENGEIQVEYNDFELEDLFISKFPSEIGSASKHPVKRRVGKRFVCDWISEDLNCKITVYREDLKWTLSSLSGLYDFEWKIFKYGEEKELVAVNNEKYILAAIKEYDTNQTFRNRLGYNKTENENVC